MPCECAADDLYDQIQGLGKVLMEEFGGPSSSETVCEMAVRVLREQRAELDEFRDDRAEYELRLAEYREEVDIMIKQASAGSR